MIKKVLFFSIALFISTLYQANGQTLAITIHGDSIYVYDNGTWSYELLEESPALSEFSFLDEEIEIDTIEQEFVFSDNLNKELRNVRDHFIIKYNSNNWKREPPALYNEDAEFALSSKKHDLWCIVISEETEIAPLSLFKIAKNMMEENIGAKVETKKVELRTVNGKEVLRAVVEAKVSGLNFIFDSYYYSDEMGSVQFTTWTGNSLWKKYEAEILELLNGFVVLKRE